MVGFLPAMTTQAPKPTLAFGNTCKKIWEGVVTFEVFEPVKSKARVHTANTCLGHFYFLKRCLFCIFFFAHSHSHGQFLARHAVVEDMFRLFCIHGGLSSHACRYKPYVVLFNAPQWCVCVCAYVSTWMVCRFSFFGSGLYCSLPSELRWAQSFVQPT